MKILVFGITGSIGNSLLEVLGNHELVGISFFNNKELALKIKNDYQVKYIYSSNFPNESNVESVDDLIKKSNPDIIVNAVTGFSGLQYTIAALNNKINLALANKESLVMAGNIVKKLAKENNVNIYPIDSEHSALFELVNTKHTIQHLYITCSGGSCYLKSENELNDISYK
ncbi:MAG: hypothetical protein ACRC4L_03770, partial [Mycoplasma sp.]